MEIKVGQRLSYRQRNGIITDEWMEQHEPVQEREGQWLERLEGNQKNVVTGAGRGRVSQGRV